MEALSDITPKIKTIIAAKYEKAFLFRSSRAVTPMAKKTGEVPRVKKNIIKAPRVGDPEATEASIIACVTPQGRKTVDAPATAGEKVFSSLLDFLASLNRNFGGWMAKYLKIGCKLISLAAVPIKY